MQTAEKPSQVAPQVSNEVILDVPLRLSDLTQGWRGAMLALEFRHYKKLSCSFSWNEAFGQGFAFALKSKNAIIH